MKPSDFIDSKASWADVMPMFRPPVPYDEDCPPLDFDALPPPVVRINGRIIPPRTSPRDPIDPEVLELMKSLNPLVQMEPEMLGGMPVFKDTLVPIKCMFDYLLAGKTIDEFVYDFPTVPRRIASKVLATQATLFYEDISMAIDAVRFATPSESS